MSATKFASITSGLLARKGDAAPSLSTLPVRPSVFAQGEAPFPAPKPRPIAGKAPAAVQKDPAPRPAAHRPAARPEPRTSPVPAAKGPEEKPRRVVITLVPEEFERLCIAAIKKDTSRHDIVHAALEAYFHQLAAELPRRCTCMAEGGCCS